MPGTGFVKVITTINGPSGLLLQKTSLDLKEAPKVKAQPDAKAATEPEKLSVGLSKEPAGNFVTTFASNTPAIYARWQSRGLHADANIRVVWIAENVADVAADYEIDDASTAGGILAAEQKGAALAHAASALAQLREKPPPEPP